MGYEYKSGYCNKCEENRKLERETVNHILHLLLSIVTAGLWIIVWILISIRVGGWNCTTCGSKSVSGIRSDSVINQIAESQTVSKISFLLNWIFGVLFFLLGVTAFISTFQTGYNNIVSSIMFLSFSFLLLPPVRKFAYEKTNIKLSRNAKIGAFTLILIISVILSTITLVSDYDLTESKNTIDNQTVIENDNKETEITYTKVDDSICNVYYSDYSLSSIEGYLSCDESKLTIEFYDKKTQQIVDNYTLFVYGSEFKVELNHDRKYDIKYIIELTEDQIENRKQEITSSESENSDVQGNLTDSQIGTFQGIILMHGYKCDTVNYASRSGWDGSISITCNDNMYSYEIKDVGGRWIVTVN